MDNMWISPFPHPFRMISDSDSGYDSGFPSGLTWVMIGFPLGYSWVMAGLSLGYGWVTTGLPLGYGWVTTGLPLGYLWRRKKRKETQRKNGGWGICGYAYRHYSAAKGVFI